MPISIFRFFAFSASLLVGLVASDALMIEEFAQPQLREVEITSIFNSVDPANDFVPEFTEVAFDEGTNHTIMEMEFVRAGEIARCTSNPAEAEKDWLVLMNRRGKFSLESRRVTYGAVERSDFGGFSKMSFAGSHSAVLIVTDQGTLNPGPVTTAYLKRPLSDDGMELYADGLSIGDLREFTLSQRKYRVRATLATLQGGHRIAAIVLEHGHRSQIIWYKSYFFADSNGELEWVGDLDGDDKLDLLFSSYASNGGQLQSYLFLSTFAVENNLVGFAGFYSARCTA